jgi:high-affinity K+ transport system ATPase subunit B
VVRESGGDRSAVTGGTEVLSDHIAVRIASNLMEIVRIPHHLQHRQ